MVPMPGGRRMEIATDLRLGPGDSVAVQGVCLTVTEVRPDLIAVDVSPETLRATTLGGLRPGALLNLEPPVRPDTPLGGHFVQGHVDVTAAITGLDEQGAFRRMTIAYPAAMAPLLIPKGSIAVDGVSLTVAALRDGAFEVQIIPHTWDHTSFRASRPGDRVNLEADMLGKYVVRIGELAGWGALRPAPERG
jgi:riboflavin synthase alpha subunit